MKPRPSSTKQPPPMVSRVTGWRASQAEKPTPASIWQAGAMTAPWASGACAKPVMKSRLKTGPDSAASTRPRRQPRPARSRQPQCSTTGSMISAPGTKRSSVMSSGDSPDLMPSRASTE